MNRRLVNVALGAATALVVALGYHFGTARASGIPTTGTLAYSGSVLDNGVPDNGSHLIVINLWTAGSTPACSTTPSANTQLVNGRFTIPLDPSCVPVIHQNPNVQVEVVIDGTSMGKTPLAAVPYAVEADTASNFAPGSAIASLVPSGTVVPFAGAVGGNVMPPPGWLLCDGSARSRATYASLFAAIGTGWGSGDGATTFNLPDLRGLFLRGVDAAASHDPDANARTPILSGGNAGAKVGSYEADSFASHAHAEDPYTMTNQPAGGGNPNFWALPDGLPGTGGEWDNSNAASGSSLLSTGPAGASTETRPRNAAVNYIIKL